MTQERMPHAAHPPTPGSVGAPAPGAPSPGPGVADRPLDEPRSLHILSTEHWSLLATR